MTSAAAVFGRPSFWNCNAGSGLADFNGPEGAVFDSNGTLWVANSFQNLVKQFRNALSLGSYPTPNSYLGTGAAGATQNTFFQPEYLGIDAANGHLFVSDLNHRVLLFRDASHKPNSADADVVFGQATFTASSPACAKDGLNAPAEPFYDATTDTLFVADFGRHRF